MENFYTKDLTVGYNGKPVLKQVDLSLKCGEILTLIGPNGAGKTTLLKSLIRQLAPVGGMVILDGRNLKEYTGREIASRISVVLTDRIRPERMTCREVVGTGRYPYTGTMGFLSENDRSVIQEAMKQVGVEVLADREYGKISDGQKQRVLLARAIAQEPEILVLDEPTSYLDIRYKLEFLSVLQKLKRQKNLSVILSMHELDLALRISDRIACVCDERIDRVGIPEKILTPGYIRSLYGMTTGSYCEQTGCAELEAVRGEPKVFVIAGNGNGTPVFRRLQREGIPFAAGILWENDLDYPAALALASEVYSVPPYMPVREETILAAMRAIDTCEQVICTVSNLPDTEASAGIQRLCAYAREQGKGASVSATCQEKTVDKQ